MANEKVQRRYRPRIKKQNGQVYARMEPESEGDWVRYSDHAAREKELLDALREYQASHINCSIQRMSDGVYVNRCRLCKRADLLLEGKV